MKVVFYKGTRPGLAGIYSVGVSVWTRSPYSHCEILFSDGTAWSSSFIDKGVRPLQNFRFHITNEKDWDVIELPDSLEPAARKWFEDHKGQRYDLIGNLHFVVSAIGDDKNKWFCSEACAAALGFEHPERFNPGDFYQIVKRMSELLCPSSVMPLAA